MRPVESMHPICRCRLLPRVGDRRSQSRTYQRCKSHFSHCNSTREKAAQRASSPSNALAKTEGNASFTTSRLNTTLQLTMLARAFASDEENSGVYKDHFDNNKAGGPLVQYEDQIFKPNLSTSYCVKSASSLGSSKRLAREARFELSPPFVRFTFPSRVVPVSGSGHFGEKVGKKVQRPVSYA